MVDPNDTVKLSPEQLLAIAKASSAQEVAEICRADWVPPNLSERMAADEIKAQQLTEPYKPKYRSVDGFLVPNE